MDLPTAAAAPIVRTIGGKQVEFRTLRLEQMAELLVHWRERDRNKLIADLDDSKVEPSERLKELRKLDSEPMTVGSMVMETFSVAGAIDVLRKSCSVDLGLVDLPADELITLAASLCGFKVAPVEADEAPQPEEASGPDPTTGAPTETGS